MSSNGICRIQATPSSVFLEDAGRSILACWMEQRFQRAVLACVQGYKLDLGERVQEKWMDSGEKMAWQA